MYSNAQYYKSLAGSLAGIRVDISGARSFVPIDPANSDYANMMALVAAGQLTVAPVEA
jgi:hypothetical protein